MPAGQLADSAVVGHQNDSKGAIPFNPNLKAGVPKTHFQITYFLANLLQSKSPESGTTCLSIVNPLGGCT